MPAFHRLDIGASKSLVTPHQRQAVQTPYTNEPTIFQTIFVH